VEAVGGEIVAEGEGGDGTDVAGLSGAFESVDEEEVALGVGGGLGFDEDLDVGLGLDEATGEGGGVVGARPVVGGDGLEVGVAEEGGEGWGLGVGGRGLGISRASRVLGFVWQGGN